MSVVLPWPAKRVFYRLLGYDVHPDAHVGLSYLDAREVVLRSGTFVGHFNVVRRLERFELGRNAYVKNFNVFSGPQIRDWPRTLRLGDGAWVMNLHYFEVGGKVEIGDGAVIGGRGTQVYTHEIGGEGEARGLRPDEVWIGPHTYVGASSILVPGARLNEGCVLGAGSVLTKGQNDCPPGTVLAGNPAQVVKEPA